MYVSRDLKKEYGNSLLDLNVAAYAWQVQAISCNELQDMLNSSEPIVLVDVRSPNEQSVSILPGHVVRKEDFDRHLQDYSDSKIVTYWYAIAI